MAAMPLLAIAFSIALHPHANALVVPGPWEMQVYYAPFVGIVECEVAGLGAGTFRVIESWLGLPVGSRLVIEDQAPFGQPSLSLHLCGERYVMCTSPSLVSKAVPSDTWSEYGSTGPLTWRDPGASLSVLWPVRIRPKGNSHGYRLEDLGIYPGNLAAYRESVLTCAARPESLRERAALVRYLTYSLKSGLDLAGADSTLISSKRRLLDQLPLLGASQIVAALAELDRRHPEPSVRLLESTAMQVGGRTTLGLIRSVLAENDQGLNTRGLEWAASRIEERLPGAVRVRRRFDPGPVVDASTLSSDLAALHDSLAPFGEEAAVRLILARPEAIATYLMTMHPRPSPARPSRVGNYTLVSYLGWKCPSDRSGYLRRLIDSGDPVVRVGAAIYLSLEDSAFGVARLRDLRSSPGFAGWWANVALARRGDRDAVDSLLGRLGVAFEETETFRQSSELFALLSNSARSSGLRQPPVDESYLFDPRYKGSKKAIRRLREWWSQAREHITLFDPWLPLFSSQHLD